NGCGAVRGGSGQGEYCLVLGACEAVRPHLMNAAGNDWEKAWHELQGSGLRLLLLAEAPESKPFNGSLEGFSLAPLALVTLSDELRPETGAVLEAVAAQGITFKILSGDNPLT